MRLKHTNITETTSSSLNRTHFPSPHPQHTSLAFTPNTPHLPTNSSPCCLIRCIRFIVFNRSREREVNELPLLLNARVTARVTLPRLATPNRGDCKNCLICENAWHFQHPPPTLARKYRSGFSAQLNPSADWQLKCQREPEKSVYCSKTHRFTVSTPATSPHLLAAGSYNAVGSDRAGCLHQISRKTGRKCC